VDTAQGQIARNRRARYSAADNQNLGVYSHMSIPKPDKPEKIATKAQRHKQ